MNGNAHALHLSRPTYLSGIELIHAVGAVHTVAAQQHEEIEIIALSRAARRFRFRGSSQIVPPDLLTVIPSGEMHGSSSVDTLPVDARILLIHPDLLPKRLPSQISDTASVRAFTFLHERLCHAKGCLAQQSLLIELISLLERQNGDSPETNCFTTTKRRKIVERLCDYIREHCGEEIRLETLAVLVNLSPFHVCRLFRNEIGIPPHAYQLQTRIHRARLLLRQGMTPAMVANEMGFANQSHFAAHFKRLIGLTPGEYLCDGKRKNLIDDLPIRD